MHYLKRLPATLVCALTFAALAGCGSSVNLPPVEPEEVDVFLPGSLPDEEYEVLARFEERADLATEDQVLIDRVKVKAAQRGADAVIVTTIRRTTEGGIDYDLNQTQEKILEGMAIYYPSRHPELEN